MVFRNLSLFVIMNGGDGESRPPASLCSHAASSQALSACSDHSLQNRSPDGPATLVPRGVRLSRRLLHRREKKNHCIFRSGSLFSLVEMARVELASESISKGLSPSAVNVLEFRLDQRPLTGYGLSYPVSPLWYREIPQSFPV